MDTAEAFEINVIKNENSNLDKVDLDNIIFGRQFSDHMFMVDYKDGAWQTPTIRPYEHLSLSPATSAIHYGQSVFEGMKAYKNDKGEVFTFRPLDNIKRLNLSAKRMCMPEIPEKLFEEALYKLIRLDHEWIPTAPGSALYVRPFMFATDEYIGVKPSENYRFMIFTCPVNAYYPEPVKVKIETEYSRAFEGGTGFAKAAGNYAAALYPAKLAQQQGYHQLIWTDSKEHKYIEESGTMNIMFMIDGKIYTPPVSGTILDGITRKSVLQLAEDWGIEVIKRRVTVAEIVDAAKEGRLEEAFGTGTAATIAHIILLSYDGQDYELPPIESRKFSSRVGDYLDRLKRNNEEDVHGWNVQLI